MDTPATHTRRTADPELRAVAAQLRRTLEAEARRLTQLGFGLTFGGSRPRRRL